MIKKRLLPLLMAISISYSVLLAGCGCSQNTKNSADEVAQDAKDVKDDVKKGIDDTGAMLSSKITDTSMDYSMTELEKDLGSAGVDYSIEASKESLFTVDEKVLKISDGSEVRLYEYATDASAELNKDLDTVTDQGKYINGKAVEWTSNPHIYKKGRIVAVYDGNDKKTLSTLSDVLGEPIL